jgi:magnesium transporter
MKVNNPLTCEFISSYPSEAARVLELVSTEYVADFFNELSEKTGGQVVASMSPEIAAAVLEKMDIIPSANLLAEQSISSAARIYRHLPLEKKNTLFSALSKNFQKLLLEQLYYPQASVGRLLDARIDHLPDGLTVADAIRRIERLGRPVNCEIYITNDTHQLVGVIELGKLVTSGHGKRLREIMNRKTQSISAYATAESVLSHPGWDGRRRLPIVERNNVLIGVLNYTSLTNFLGESGAFTKREPMDNLLSIAALYWLSLAQLLDSILNITQQSKEGRK